MEEGKHPMPSASSAAAPRPGVVRRLSSIDRVVATFLAILAALAIVAPDRAIEGLRFTAESLWSIAPFLMISIGVAAFAKATGLDAQIGRAFAGRPRSAILMAAAVGALSPFCSCGVIPLIAGLLQAGVPLAPVMAFWIASPLMDPEMFVLTAGVMGLDFAIARAIAALAMGLAAGAATQMLVAHPTFAAPLSTGLARPGCGARQALDPAPVVWTFWDAPYRRRTFGSELGSAGWFLFRWLALAFLIESLMLAYIPAETIGEHLGGGAWWVLPAAALVGVPAYLNGYAAIPMVDGLVEMGMSAPAGLTFMIAGGVSSIPAAMAVFALVRRPVFLWYLALGFAGAILAGYGYRAALAF